MRMSRARKRMERKLGRELRQDETVHHVNGDPKNDRIENLEILPRDRHIRLHQVESIRMRYEGYDDGYS